MFQESRLAIAFAAIAFTVACSPPPAEAKLQDKGGEALSQRQLDNLVAYTKLLGYVRHFHPSDAVATANWSQVAIAGIEEIEKASGPEVLAEKLQSYFAPYAPTVRVYVTGRKPTGAIPPPPDDTSKYQVVRWTHLGFGGGTLSNNVYSSKRTFAAYTTQVPMSFDKELAGGVSCTVPFILFAKDGKAQPPTQLPTLPQHEESGNDRSTRLAAVILGWNILQHFYMYFDVVKVDWHQVLRDSLSRAASDKTDREFLDTLRHMLAMVQDGHGNVNHSSDRDFYSPPFKAKWVEGKLVVTEIGSGLKGVVVGDVVESIDGKSVEERYKKLEPLLSGATEQWRRNCAVDELLRGHVNTSMKLVLNNESGEKNADVRRDVLMGNAFVDPPKPVRELEPGIWYVNIDSAGIQMKEYLEMVPKLAQAKGIVFDLRGYPNEVASDLIYRIHDGPVTSAHFEIPKISQPDHVGVTYTDGAWPPSGPEKEMFKGRIAFLADGQCISYAESIMGIVEHYKMGAIVGSTTAGTNGNVNPFLLPGHYYMVFTGMRVRKHDGSSHHGVGIKPTIPIEPTIAGIRAGRDEVLERGLQYVKTGS